MKNNNPNHIFITGIDTDAGKTVVTAGLLRYFRHHHLQAIAMKPVQTGCLGENGQRSLPDLEVYNYATQMELSEEELNMIVPYRYDLASSPHLAAEETGQFPKLDVIKQAFDQLKNRYEMILAEGAGGILVPLNKNQTMLDLVKHLSLPVVIVVDNRLGMINHSLLTVEVLKQHNIDIKGFIITNSTPAVDADAKLIRDNNSVTIAEMSGIDVVAEIPFIDGFDETSEATWKQIDHVFEINNVIEKLGLEQ